MYRLFIAECKKQMFLQEVTQPKLAKMTGIPYQTIRNFFCGVCTSDNVAHAIDRALNMKYFE